MLCLTIQRPCEFRKGEIMNIFYEVQAILNQKRIDNGLKAKQLKRDAMEIDGVEELEIKRRGLIYQIAYDGFNGLNVDALRQELKETEESENRRLAERGISIADFESKVDCKECNDTGWANGEKCGCAKRIATQLLLERSGFGRELKTFADSDFAIFEDAEKMRKTFEGFQRWANTKDTPITTLLFLGDTGTGKTFTTECLASEFIKNGYYVYFTTAFNMIGTCRDYHFGKDSELSTLQNCEVLCIDDLGTEPMLANITQEYLLAIINERTTNGLRTIISTNLTQQQITDRYDARIFSRVFSKRNGFAIKFNGKDLRTAENKLQKVSKK